ncbi:MULTISPECIES: glycosyltransferase family 4 protein [Colwellia]|uniref:Glycosyl transferase family 1 n=1 Tax=Colwellia marinimaniae TaxID=1513592 RepID=A0ABQ0MT43_9GAMM|nr:MULTISPECIES: glycosyltransferase family 4 protein [Colwellia]GAW95526.1 glycosyl transferase family 1 [Colwellia marinimaniae]
MNKSLLISEIFPPINGGSGRWFWELYTRLPSSEYVIAVGKTEGDKAFDKTHDLNIHRLELSSPSWGIKSLSGLKFYWRVFNQVRKLIKQEKISTIHCGRCLPEGFIGYLFYKMFNIPYICYIHGEDVEAASTSRELSWIVKKVLASATTLICNSQNTANLLLNNWQADSRIIKILNPGCDTNKFIPAEPNEHIKSKLGWHNKKVILTVGRLQERKGQDMLIRAIPAIKQFTPNILYAIIGGGEEKLKLEQLVNELNLQDNVMFMSEVSDEEMIQAYQQCDLFVLPNRTVGKDIEGFGMVLVEAQSCGIPVIAGDSGGTAETMVIGKTGFIVDCTEPQPIANKIIELFKHPDIIEQLGNNGRKHVVKTLDWQAHKNKAEKLFS